MDEPTSSLTERETQLLFEIIKNLKKSGVTVIYISHRLNEVFQSSTGLKFYGMAVTPAS